jgi:hypothetical protein
MLHRNRNACIMHGVNTQRHPALADLCLQSRDVRFASVDVGGAGADSFDRSRGLRLTPAAGLSASLAPLDDTVGIPESSHQHTSMPSDPQTRHATAVSVYVVVRIVGASLSCRDRR